MNVRRHPLWILISIMSSLMGTAFAQTAGLPTKSSQKRVLGKGEGNPSYAVLNMRNIVAWQQYEGQGFFPPSHNNEIYFPRGTANVVYKDGIVWGAKAFLDASHSIPVANHSIRVGGSTYGSGIQPGYVTGSGATAAAASPFNPEVRFYRIRRDYYSLKNPYGDYSYELQRDAADVNEIPISGVTSTQMDAVFNQYDTDWKNWPVQLGAPYIERNGISGYQSPPPFSVTFNADSLISGHYDEPGISGPETDSPADQVIWTVYNDLDSTTTLSFLASEPLGLEIQKTLWAYNSSSPLSDIYFVRHRLINKGGVDIDTSIGMQTGGFYLDSMYVTQWSDPDVGRFTDDLIGCDTLLDLAFAYNHGQDPDFKNFGLPPPSVGYALLQGPLVISPQDTGTFDMRPLAGFRNERMTSFSYEGTGTPYSDPPNAVQAGYEGTTGQWWKIMRGFAPLGTMYDPDQYYAHPPGTSGTKFPFSGDPVTGTGFLDGEGTSWSYRPGDMKMMLNSGPFSLALGDTQEVVVAFTAGLGADALSSITVMKTRARFARTVFGAGLSVPQPPSTPSLKATALDGQIILNWGSDPSSARALESTIIARKYRFQGYNVYQLPPTSSRLEDGTRIATFDVIDDITSIVDADPADPSLQRVVEEGHNSGVQRYLSLTRDHLPNSAGQKLYNGQKYSFAVTAYNYSPDLTAFPKSLESAPVIVTVTPQIPFGTSLPTHTGDTLSVAHTTGTSDGIVTAVVIDPLESTGQRYKISFDTTGAATQWNLFNATTNSIILSDVPFDHSGSLVEGGILITFAPSPTQPFTAGDIYTYILPPVQKGIDKEKASAQRVGVFPNPYYAGRSQETTTWRHFVTFNNLPPRVTIRIFNLAGHLVRTLEKNDPAQFLEWDLTNKDNWQVASGIYVCYVEMPDIGGTKVLKVAVILPQGTFR